MVKHTTVAQMVQKLEPFEVTHCAIFQQQMALFPIPYSLP
jgi:hypothetical protein